jgi:hypothetical protein
MLLPPGGELRGAHAAPAAAPLDSKVVKRAGMVVSIALAKLTPHQFNAVDVSYEQMPAASTLWPHGFDEATVLNDITAEELSKEFGGEIKKQQVREHKQSSKQQHYYLAAQY